MRSKWNETDPSAIAALPAYFASVLRNVDAREVKVYGDQR
jgi:hypothetical protein